MQPEQSSRGCIHDTLVDLKFRISPTAFFQVNSSAACLIYKVCASFIMISPCCACAF